jgi:non-specific serine/threonine protein kinase/serine/threonine-protein kinase
MSLNMEIGPERWQLIKGIFDQAAEHGPESRAAVIRECCGNDEELRRDVESLLISDAATCLVLDGPLMETRAKERMAPPGTAPRPAVDDSFGPYVPAQVLGEGGMGTVYLARQQHPICRDVALKVVKSGMDSCEVMERFESERQALALMDHPNVARVLDAGRSELGRPYFVMEYVDGIPINRYCDERALSTRERLRLFVPVCNALQHAHKKGIIHRDVKPSNVLVTEVDGKPVPKVIDFGIARAIDQRVYQFENCTLAGQIIGTPEYMSPEQADLNTRDIDTGTDVYSLGVLLYELLVGALPLDVKALRRLGLVEVLRAIRETPVPKPTTRITQMGAAAETAAQLRGVHSAQLKRDLAGDLDWIVMKAMDKDRQRRYVSAAELAADIERYLRSEPVLAGAPGPTYYLQKFVARHKGPVAATAAVLVALVAGMVTTVWQADKAAEEKAVAVRERSEADRQRSRAEEQASEADRQRDSAQSAGAWATAAERAAIKSRDRAIAAELRAQAERSAALAQKRRADDEAATAKAVNEFLQNDLLGQASADAQARPGTKPDPDLKVRTALDRAAARLEGKFQQQPLVEASIRQTIGETYRNLALYPEAEVHLERCLALRRSVLGEAHPDTLRSATGLGHLYILQGKYSQGEQMLAKVVDLDRRVLGEQNPDTVDAMDGLASACLFQGKYTASESLRLRVVEISRNMLGEDHPDTLIYENNLAFLYGRQGKYRQAETLFAKVVEAERRVLGEEHPESLKSMQNLAQVYRYLGKYAVAEALLTRLREVQLRILGQEHRESLVTMGELATVWALEGHYDKAEGLLVQLLELDRRVQGEEHPDTLITTTNLATLYRDEGKHAEAEVLFLKVLDAERRVIAQDHPTSLLTMNELAILYERQDKLDQAEAMLSKVLLSRRRVLGPEHPRTVSTLASLGRIRLRQQRYSEAAAALRDALTTYRKILPDAWERFNCESMLGAAMAGDKDYANSEPLLLAGYDGMIQREDTIPAAARPALREAGARIVRLYQAWGKADKAGVWESKLQPNDLPAPSMSR